VNTTPLIPSKFCSDETLEFLLMKPLLSSATPLLLLISFASAAALPSPTEPRSIPLPPAAVLPQWPKPAPPELGPGALAVRSRDLEILHSPNALGAFVVKVANQPMAIGQTRPMLGYLADGQLRWLDLANAKEQRAEARSEGKSVRCRFQCADTDGARWQIKQQFSPARLAGAIDITTEVTVDQERAVAFLPMLMIFPGAGTFGEAKGQALLAGLEYLENEPSSSEADVIGPASQRQVPDNSKLTFPLMALQRDNRYLGLTWQMRPHFSALFDSPDRIFASGGHVMGVLFPGSDRKNREEGKLLPKEAQVLSAGQPITLVATIMGGPGKSIVPPVQQYIALRGLPSLPVPRSGEDAAAAGAGTQALQQYVSVAAGGWLDSKLREGNLFRHAIAGGNFQPGRAADAALWMDWLGVQTHDPALAGRLKETAKAALAEVPPADLNFAGVGHVRFPVEALVYGHVAENAERAEQSGRSLLGTFAADGSMKYHPHPGGVDYGKTHFTDEATGFTARPVLDLLEAAAFSGNRELLDAALSRLHAMDKFRNGVPRGAQTWECPLHTPDILASAWMVRACTLGYELSGQPELLEQAQYWAWTGVPFVYLVNPTPQAIALYATIAVYGATQWKAPVWLGLPVQWCGLVYADALYRLVRDDPRGPWKKLADGITASGIQQTWPQTDTEKQGLLPDSFVLRSQTRNGPAINPATLEACAVRYFAEPPVYDFWCFRQNGLRVHAPGEIKHAQEKKGQVSFKTESWVDRPYYVLINGLAARPRLKINGKITECSAPHQFLEKEGRLLLQLEGKPRVEIQL
jgi:hypothetical protein